MLSSTSFCSKPDGANIKTPSLLRQQSGYCLEWRLACLLASGNDRLPKCQTMLSGPVVSLHSWHSWAWSEVKQITAACKPPCVLQRLHWPDTLAGMCSIESPHKLANTYVGLKCCPLLVWGQEVPRSTFKLEEVLSPVGIQDVKQSSVVHIPTYAHQLQLHLKLGSSAVNGSFPVNWRGAEGWGGGGTPWGWWGSELHADGQSWTTTKSDIRVQYMQYEHSGPLNPLKRPPAHMEVNKDIENT